MVCNIFGRSYDCKVKILIFGGGYGFIEFYDFGIDYWKEAEVYAILDNDKEKWGKNIHGIPIVSPGHICQYECDVILICSVYEDEIEEQLTHEFCVNKEKIETRRHFFEEVIFPWYEKKYGNKKILIVGERFKFDILHQLYYEFFNIVGFVDLDEIALADDYDYDYILLTNYEGKKELDIVNGLMHSRYIKKECLLTDSVFLVFRSHIKRCSYGEKYPDKKFLLICTRGYSAGLGAICRMVINNIPYARQNGYIPIIDMKNYRNQYLEEEEYGKINAWEKFFFQPEKYTLEDIEEAKYVLKVFEDIRWQPVYKKYIQPYFPQMQYNLSEKCKKYLEKVEEKRILGVLFRGTDYSQQKPFGLFIQPDLETIIQVTWEKIKKWGGYDLVFLCTEVQQACDRFEAEFGDKVFYYPQLRFDAETNVARLALYSFGIQGERTRRGEDYWIALNILASCNSLIAGRCTGTDMALLMNDNRYENVYLFELGRYGIDSQG